MILDSTHFSLFFLAIFSRYLEEVLFVSGRINVVWTNPSPPLSHGQHDDLNGRHMDAVASGRRKGIQLNRQDNNLDSNSLTVTIFNSSPCAIQTPLI